MDTPETSTTGTEVTTSTGDAQVLLQEEVITTDNTVVVATAEPAQAASVITDVGITTRWTDAMEKANSWLSEIELMAGHGHVELRDTIRARVADLRNLLGLV